MLLLLLLLLLVLLLLLLSLLFLLLLLLLLIVRALASAPYQSRLQAPLLIPIFHHYYRDHDHDHYHRDHFSDDGGGSRFYRDFMDCYREGSP